MDKISDLKSVVINTLDLNKAQDIVTIDLKDKSSMADYMIIASGTHCCITFVLQGAEQSRCQDGSNL